MMKQGRVFKGPAIRDRQFEFEPYLPAPSRHAPDVPRFTATFRLVLLRHEFLGRN